MNGDVQRTWVRRSDYVTADDEARYLTRDSSNRPNLSLVYVDDRLAVWATTLGGALINPRGPGLRKLGLITTQVRGSAHRPQSTHYRAADLRAGAPLELLREPDNPHDANAVALLAGGQQVGHVQRGRAAAVTRNIDAGQNWGGVALHGPPPGSIDETCRILLGNEDDLAHMLGR